MVPGNVVVPDEVVPLQFPSVVDGLEGDVTVLVRFPSRGEAVLQGSSRHRCLQHIARKPCSVVVDRG